MFTDGGEGGAETTRSDQRFRRRINRAIEALRTDVTNLKDEMEISRRRNGRPARREGFLVTLGNWVVRFVGVTPVPPTRIRMNGVLMVVLASTCIV